MVALMAVLALSACARDTAPQLMNLRSATNGPDEFGIVPPKALELPSDMAALPPPTPGQANRTDPTPRADAIAALGGDVARTARGDTRLMTHVARFGVAPDIRETLAVEDLEYRRKNNGRVLERLFKVTVYYRAYAPQALDPQAELAHWRALGLPTPSAPPAGAAAELAKRK